MEKARDLLKMTSSIIDNNFPELKEAREGLTPVYGQIIFACRVEKGYSQEQLAELANVDSEIIYRIEGGYDSLPTSTYDKVFRALGLSTKDIGKAMLELQAANDELALTI